MKKLFLFAFVSLSLFSSCSSDDSINVTEEKLTKKWYYKSYKVNGTTGAYEHLPCGKDYIELLPDGIYREFYINECDPIVSGTSTGSWIIDGTTIAIAIEGDSYSGKITKLSATDLQIKATTDFDEDGEDEVVLLNYTSN